MNDDQFDKIFAYLQKMDHRLQYVEDNMATKESIDHLINTMDDFSARLLKAMLKTPLEMRNLLAW